MVLRSGVEMVPDLDIWRPANLLIRKQGGGEARRPDARSR
jgi:hypothetical protein